MSVNILTIDDSKTVRMIVAKSFKPYDCIILEGANGVEGLAVAAREKPDIIILDLTMPVMDGYETLTKLKANPELKGIPVIMLTAEAGKENVLRIAKLGVRDYLVKPFKEEVVVERVNRVTPLTLRGEAAIIPKKVDDAVSILVLDDKPAILNQILAGFANSPWKINAVGSSAEAMDLCVKAPIDIALVSLSLPANAAFLFLQALRINPKTNRLPVLGLSVKTAVEDQSRAQQAGFAGIVTKPIDFEDLKGKICRTLSLDVSSQYFTQRDGVLVATAPADLNQAHSNCICAALGAQTSAAVDSGLDKVILDLSRVQKTDLVVVKLILATIQACEGIGLHYAIVGSPAVSAECKIFQETQHLSMASTFDEAIFSFDAKPVAA